MNCPYCGTQAAEGAAFCGNCGAKLETLAAAVSPAPWQESAEGTFTPSVETVAPPPAFTPSYSPAAAAPKKRNTVLIIAIVVIVLLLLCCCCLIFGVYPFLGPLMDTNFQNIMKGLK